MPDIASLGLAILIPVFLGAALVVWFAGARLANLASEIADRTGLNQAIIGVILLGGATSLPEISTSGVATLAGNPGMAVNNLLGGVAFQVVVLAIADLFVGRGALTTMIPGPRVMSNAVISILLLALASIGATSGDISLPFVQMGAFPILIAICYVGSLWLLGGKSAASGWSPVEPIKDVQEEKRHDEISFTSLFIRSALAAVAILVAGTILTLSAEAIAGDLGIDLGIAGLTFLAVATSLPEISTAITAARLKRAEMVIGDVLGGNMFDIMLLVFVDGLYTGGIALQQADRSSIVMALTAIFLTGLLLLGLIERRDRAAMRMGYDMIAILVTYISATTAIVMGVFAET